MKYQLFIVITFLLMVLGEPLFAVSYTPTTYTSSYSSTSSPSVEANPASLATTLEDESNSSSSPAMAIARALEETPLPPEPPEEEEDSPLGDTWILLLFAVLYATFSIVRRHRIRHLD